MAVTKIFIRLQTLTPQPDTVEPLYVGIVTQYGGREFPLRYKRGGQKISAGQTLEFGINDSELPADKQIFDSAGSGRNALETYPLDKVERVYLRKEAIDASFDRDNAIGIEYIGVFVTEFNAGTETTTDWSNRNRPDSSGPSPFWLGNEYGQMVYLTPD